MLTSNRTNLALRYKPVRKPRSSLKKGYCKVHNMNNTRILTLIYPRTADEAPAAWTGAIEREITISKIVVCVCVSVIKVYSLSWSFICLGRQNFTLVGYSSAAYALSFPLRRVSFPLFPPSPSFPASRPTLVLTRPLGPLGRVRTMFCG